jgi:hypothetical protein
MRKKKLSSIPNKSNVEGAKLEKKIKREEKTDHGQPRFTCQIYGMFMIVK